MNQVFIDKFPKNTKNLKYINLQNINNWRNVIKIILNR